MLECLDVLNNLVNNLALQTLNEEYIIEESNVKESDGKFIVEQTNEQSNEQSIVETSNENYILEQPNIEESNKESVVENTNESIVVKSNKEFNEESMVKLVSIWSLMFCQPHWITSAQNLRVNNLIKYRMLKNLVKNLLLKNLLKNLMKKTFVEGSTKHSQWQ